MSGRPCVSCGREIPGTIFAQAGQGEVFCPWCAASQSPAAAEPAAAVAVEAGHPKVRRVVEGDVVSYETRMGSCFGWFWLLFTIVHCAFMFYGMSQGNVKVNGRMVANPEWWYFALLALFLCLLCATALAFFLAVLFFRGAGCRIFGFAGFGGLHSF